MTTHVFVITLLGAITAKFMTRAGNQITAVGALVISYRTAKLNVFAALVTMEINAKITTFAKLETRVRMAGSATRPRIMGTSVHA